MHSAPTSLPLPAPSLSRLYHNPPSLAPHCRVLRLLPRTHKEPCNFLCCAASHQGKLPPGGAHTKAMVKLFAVKYVFWGRFLKKSRCLRVFAGQYTQRHLFSKTQTSTQMHSGDPAPSDIHHQKPGKAPWAAKKWNSDSFHHCDDLLVSLVCFFFLQTSLGPPKGVHFRPEEVNIAIPAKQCKSVELLALVSTSKEILTLC